MLKVIDWILLPRDTRELGRLNDIHEAFNDKRLTGEETRHEIYSYSWKYHHEKIDMLILFTGLLK